MVFLQVVAKKHVLAKDYGKKIFFKLKITYLSFWQEKR